MTKGCILVILLNIFCLEVFSQQGTPQSSGFGLKAGYNFAKVTGASSLNPYNTNGYHIGGFFSPGTSKGFGYRTEIIYSKQGYNFADGTTLGSVDLNYILLPQLTTFNITKFLQLQLGAQIAFLINAKADSSGNNGPVNPYEQVMGYYNKFDYGFTGGIELHPFAGLLIGARLNISLANANKDPSSFPGALPPFIPNTSDINLKNNVLQIFAGWNF
jgi:hypothetical protein